MKTIFMLIVSSIFLSTVSNKIEKDSIEKVMTYKIQKTEKIKIESATISTRTPIIILKKD
ncbi:hypothetical protein B0I03_103211 [Flavobacterium aquaticum]|uniref:Uncharacterized protein n=1 Tax=Flavobacterium aquaticum TaxID=1236486 RepID=A0A327YVJ9_9FLAO|nr:hypothetical protein B0I03_103211 [Flavobacterium aquaticum]